MRSRVVQRMLPALARLCAPGRIVARASLNSKGSLLMNSMNAQRTPSETTPPRMDALARLPVFFALGGKRVVVAGGNAAAAWKVELLSAAGAHVQVFADDVCDELLAVAN